MQLNRSNLMPPLPKSSPFVVKHWGITIPLLILVLLLAHLMALIYRIEPAVSLWFPPSGVAIALTFWFGPIGAIITGIVAIVMGPFWGNQGWVQIAGVTDALEPLVAWFLYRRYWKGSLGLKNLRDVVAFILSAPLAACATSSVIGSLVLTALGKMSLENLPTSISYWWLGNAIGTLAVVPVALLVLTPFLQKYGWLADSQEPQAIAVPSVNTSNIAWEILAILVISVCTAVLTVSKTEATGFAVQQFSFLTFVPILWAAIRFGAVGGVLTSGFCVLVTLLAYLFTYPNAISLSSFPLPAEILHVHKLSLLVQCAISLLVGTATKERETIKVALAVEQVQRAEYQTRAELSDRLIQLNQSLGESNHQKDRALEREQIARLEAETAKEQFSSILQSITDGFLAFDRQWHFTYLNQEGARTLGRQPEELLGKNLWVEFPELADTSFGKLYQQALSEGVPLELEDYYPPFDTWFAVRAYPSSAGLSLYFRNISDRKLMEAKLLDSEARFRTSLETMLDAAIVNSAIRGQTGEIIDFRIEYINAAGCKSNQMSLEEQIGKNICDLFPVYQKNGLFSKFVQVVETGEPAIEEYVIYEENNGQQSVAKALDIRIAKLGDGIIATWRDITKRKQLDNELYRREQEFKALAQNSPDMICRLDRELRFLYVNPAVEQITGQSSEEFIGQTVPKLGFIKEKSIKWQAILQEVFATGEERTIEFDLNTLDSKTRYYQARLVPEFCQDGSTVSVLAVTRDITDFKQALIALQESELRYSILVEAMPAIILTSKPDGRCDYANQQWYDYTGGNYEQTKDSGWQSYLHPDDVQPCITEWIEVLRIGSSFETEYRFKGRDGNYRWFLARGMPIRDPQGQIIKWLGVCTDIDDRQRAEAERHQLLEREQAARTAAETANRIKDEFLAVLSHELRSPLNPILGWAKLLRTRKFEQKTIDRALETIERNANLQTQLIEDLLDVSRILQGKLSLNVRPVNLIPVIEASMETVRLAAEAKSIEIQTIFDSEVGQVSGDPNRLQQVIWNLLTNAVKFTPIGGKVKIYLSKVQNPDMQLIQNSDAQSRISQNCLYAQITVSDTGKGINPEFIPYVFDYFRQADSTTTRKFGGLGLGLAIVRHLVELHGGTVGATSLGEGQGATFTVMLPLMKTQLIADENKDAKICFPDIAGLQILIVDDEMDSREFLAFVLEQYGAKVTAVNSADQALNLLAQSLPDLIVSDIGMPEKDGYMFMRQIRSFSPEQGGKIPAIALTAYAAEADYQQALAAGFQIHLSKPVEPADLVVAIANLLGRDRCI